MTKRAKWLSEQIQKVQARNLGNPNLRVEDGINCVYVYVGSVVHYFEDTDAAPRFQDVWTDHGDEDYTTARTLCHSIDEVEYTATRNKRYPDRDYWTLLANGKPFATIEPTDRDGWRGTFSRTGLSNSLWGMSDACSLVARVEKMHNAAKEFLARVEVI